MKHKDKAMAEHNEVGKKGEELAIKYLTENGYKTLFRNWRHSYYEIDLIAFKKDILHFIEVKTRTTDSTLPEEAVDDVKIDRLVEAGEEFLETHHEWKRVQFDILSITILRNKPVEYFLIEDVYL